MRSSPCNSRCTLGLQLTVISISNSTMVCTVWLPLEQKISSIIYNSSLNYLSWKGYVLLVYNHAIWCLWCFCTHNYHYFACLLPDSIDICETLMKFGGFLLVLWHMYMTSSVGPWWRVTLHHSETCWKSRCAQAAAELGRDRQRTQWSSQLGFGFQPHALHCCVLLWKSASSSSLWVFSASRWKSSSTFKNSE